MEKIVVSCKLFYKKVKCDLNTTTRECERTKTSLMKYCGSKECQGVYRVFSPGICFKTSIIILAITHALNDCFPKIENIPRARSLIVSVEKTTRESQNSVKI